MSPIVGTKFLCDRLCGPVTVLNTHEKTHNYKVMPINFIIVCIFMQYIYDKNIEWLVEKCLKFHNYLFRNKENS